MRNTEKFPGVLDLYLARADGVLPQTPIYPPEREREILSCKNEKLRRLKTADWRLLEKALKFSFGIKTEDLKFTKTDSGKWLSDNVFFSLSHSGDFVAVAVSDAPVGIDIEDKGGLFAKLKTDKNKLSSLAKKVFSADERENTALTPENFIETWCLKEAIFKCRGEGFFTPDKIAAQQENAAVFDLGNEMPVLAVCSAALSRARFFIE